MNTEESERLPLWIYEATTQIAKHCICSQATVSAIIQQCAPKPTPASPQSAPAGDWRQNAAKEINELSERPNSDGFFTGIRFEEALAVLDCHAPAPTQQQAEQPELVHIHDSTLLAPEMERLLTELHGGRIPYSEPLTPEEMASLSPETHAYFDWVKRVLKTDEKLPLAKVAWDAGIEYARSLRPEQQAEAGGEQLARLFHDTYERLAPQFGYETRNDTKQFDPATPNGRLMIAVCNEVAHAIATSRDMGELENVIRWALGEVGEFPDWPESVSITGNPKYWWRKELRARFEAAKLASPRPESPEGEQSQSKAEAVGAVPFFTWWRSLDEVTLDTALRAAAVDVARFAYDAGQKSAHPPATQNPPENAKGEAAASLPIYDRNHLPMGVGDRFIYQPGTPYEQIVSIEHKNGVEWLSFSNGVSGGPLADFWYAKTDEAQSLKLPAVDESPQPTPSTREEGRT